MHDILHNGEAFSALLSNLTINVTEMFRDPDFYQAFREKVVPVLRTHPFLKVWHAGCATGEEIYSMAILLKEEGLYDRCQIYATDIDKEVLEKARRGIFPASELRRFTENYERSGGKKKLSDYYTEKYDNIIMDPALKKNVIFADHDLATDQVFGEMQVVLCRNVLIYFNKELQKRVFRLFKDSLDIAGYLCLGSKESLRFSGCADAFDIIEEKQRIYKKRM
jgi:chemotaxis protein methyltransferase CheR